MNLPNIACKVSIGCAIYPSEDETKIKQALGNIFPELNLEQKNHSLHASSNNLHCLEKIYQDIQNKQSQRSFSRQFRKNMYDNSLWFYLNKQAAFAGVIALCERDDESPLGPIKISIQSAQTDRIIEWLLQT